MPLRRTKHGQCGGTVADALTMQSAKGKAMPKSGRGVLYVVWGNKIEPTLQRFPRRYRKGLRRTHQDLAFPKRDSAGAQGREQLLPPAVFHRAKSLLSATG